MNVLYVVYETFWIFISVLSELDYRDYSKV